MKDSQTYENFNFTGLFDAMEKHFRVPNAAKDKSFRLALISVLEGMDNEVDNEETNEFRFSEDKYLEYIEILQNKPTPYNKNTFNRAANYIITAWELGYGK